MNRKDVEDMTSVWLRGKPVKPVDVFENVWSVAAAIEYFRDLDTVQITGNQVAIFFTALLADGRHPIDAADDAGLPEYPEFIEDLS